MLSRISAVSARRRRLAIAAAGVFLIVVAAVALARTASIALGFYAKSLCSGVFVSGRAPERVVAEDLLAYRPALVFAHARWAIERGAGVPAGRVHANLFGTLARSARFDPGVGCALDYAAARVVPAPPPAPPQPREVPVITASGALGAAVTAAFEEPDPTRPRRTRAVVVMRDGRILAERYAEGIGSATPLAGWSMAKSVVNALAGVLANEGRLALDRPLASLAPRWASRWPGDDPRAGITVRQALTMTTGLAFDERYANPFGDVMRMLFLAPDAAAVAAGRPLDHPPGTAWAYASGTTNLLMQALVDSLPAARRERFAREALFDPLGMTSAVFETDASGTPVGSSFLYASARDWATFGALYASDGVWNGRRLLPAGWVAASRAAAAGSAGRYGAHWWLREIDQRAEPKLPADAFFAAGHAGQRLTVIPSRGLVIVRLGLTLDSGAWDHPAFVAAVLEALGDTN